MEHISASTVDEFKQQARKMVQLPSGLRIEIRKVWLTDFVGLGELPLPSIEPETETQKSAISDREVHQYSIRTVIRGAVSPKFTDQDDEDRRPDRVHVRDLNQVDFTFLVTAILQWSGIRKEVAAAAEGFRTDAIGENVGRPGPALPQAADGDPGDGAGPVLSESGDRLSRGDSAKKET